MSMNSGRRNAAERVAQSIRDHWVLFLVEGIVLVVLGVLAIVVPPIATLAVTILIGWLFLISGIVGLVTTFMARHAPGFWWSLLSAVLAIAAGVVLLVWPLSGVDHAHAAPDRVLHDRGRRSPSCTRSSTRKSSRADGAGCWRAASSISCWRPSSSPGCPARRPGRSGCWSGSTCCSAASSMIAMALHARASAKRARRRARSGGKA